MGDPADFSGVLTWSDGVAFVSRDGVGEFALSGDPFFGFSPEVAVSIGRPLCGGDFSPCPEFSAGRADSDGFELPVLGAWSDAFDSPVGDFSPDWCLAVSADFELVLRDSAARSAASAIASRSLDVLGSELSSLVRSL